MRFGLLGGPLTPSFRKALSASSSASPTRVDLQSCEAEGQNHVPLHLFPLTTSYSPLTAPHLMFFFIYGSFLRSEA